MFFRFSDYDILIDLQMELPEDSIILAKTHPPMYLIHKYWARKPFNVVKKYIEKYTKPRDIVLDPFCGSGVTIAESVLAKRNAVGMDINPFSRFLTEMTITLVDLEEFKRQLLGIYSAVESMVGDLYGISCPYCGTSSIITQIIWENIEKDSQKQPDENIQEIRYTCNNCNLKNHSIDPNEFRHVYKDEKTRVGCIDSQFKELEKKYKCLIPETSFMYSNGKKFKQIRHYLIQEPKSHQLFTKRNLLVLGAIRKSIDDLIPLSSNKNLIPVRNLLLLTFSANIAQSSKMVWVITKRKSHIQKKREVGSWTHHFFWNPGEFFEINPLIGFKTRARKSILGQKNLRNRLKNEIENSIHTFSDWASYSESNTASNALILCSSSETLPIPDKSVDYIFTDPPYGDSIQYFELSSLWNNWLGFSIETQEEKEIIINLRQEKEKNIYFSKLSAVFRECYRVLKDQSYMTITFHNTDIKIRNGLIFAVQEGGFHLDSFLFQMPARNSLKSYLHYENSPVGDYFLRFKKDELKNELDTPMKPIGIPHLITQTIKGVLLERGEPTNLTFIYNCIDAELVKNKSFPLKNPIIIQRSIESLKENSIISISENNTVDLSQPNANMVPNTPLKIRIRKFLQGIEKMHTLNYSEIYNIIYKEFNGWNTPDRKEITKLIEEIK